MAKIITDGDKINEFLNSRYIEQVFPVREKTVEFFASGKQLTFYLGIDPTGPEMHLGHTTNLLLLKKLIALGHKAIFLIGDFTATIGDPSGKETARKMLTEQEVKENMKTYVAQAQKILPKGSFDVQYNSSWYNKMSARELLRLGSHFTHKEMIARDMFQERIKKDQPIVLPELWYPILQGYDSVAMKVDGEVGGNDQTFNMLVGGELTRRLLNKEKIVITTRLLEDTETGRKIMNKSEGRYIAVNFEPEDMFGKIMAMLDSTIVPLFAYSTEVTDEKVLEVKKRLDSGENPMVLKKELAYELVQMYHGEKEAQKARENFERVFSERKLPEEIREFKFSGGIIKLLEASGLAGSMSEAKRLVDQRAVSINDHVVTDWEHDVKAGDIVKVGPRRFLKIV